MAEIPQSSEELVEVLGGLQDLTFELPDPEDEEITEIEFEKAVDVAWKVCDRYDLQTEIWRGRILRIIRDREKKGGEGRGSGFLNWLKEREIGKSQAYSLIELANSADTLIQEGHLDPDSINNFSKRAFIETAKAAPEIQEMVADAAKKGDRITRREVKQLADEWTAMSSDLLPNELREKAASGSMPPKYLAPLVKELEKLPDTHQTAIKKEIAETPDIDTVKQMTSDARNLAKYLDAAAKVQALNESALDMEMVLEEALRLECVNVVADLVKQAALLENTAAKVYTTWKRVGSLAERLFVDTGASTPNLRLLLGCLDKISGYTIEVDLSEVGDRVIRLQILSEGKE